MRLMRVYQIGVLLCGLLYPVVGWSQVLSITPSLTVGERYDDNIFLTDADKEDDFITVITPRIVLRYAPSSETDIDFDYGPSFELFADETDENFIAHRLRLALRAALSRRLQVTLNNRFTITDEPDDRDRLIILEDGTRDRSDAERQQTMRNYLTSSLRFQLAPRSSIGLLFDNRIEDVEDPDELDEFSYTVGTEFGYLTHVQRQNRLLFRYTADIFNFDSNPGADPDQTLDADDFLVHTGSVGYEHHFSPTLTTTVRLGYSVTSGLETDDGDQNTGIVGGIDVEKLLRTGSATIGYERSLTSGGGEGGQVISDRVVAQLSANLSPKITAGLGANATLLDFQTQEDDDEDRVFFTIRPSLGYQVLRILLLSASYDFATSIYDENIQPDWIDHRARFESRFIFRGGWSVALSYEYRTRSFEDGAERSREEDEFTRNQVFLSVTYGPTFRF
jgi:Putative beta-barrel porin 2